jgi:hypothetical protein
VDLWHGPLSRFVRAAGSGAIAADMARSFVATYRTAPTASETRSWDRSLGALAEAVHRLGDGDVGVALHASGPVHGAARVREAPGNDVGVATELQLPLSGKRLDAVLCGTDAAEGRPRAVVVELKQWTAVDLDEEGGLNVRLGTTEKPHPSQQALDYAQLLAEYHDAFTEHGTAAEALAYCHDLAPAGRAALRDARFSALLERSPLFAAGEEPALEGHLRARVGAGRGMEVLDRVVVGRFRPSATVLARLEDVIRSRAEWHLVDEQRVAHQAILAAVRRARAGRGKKCVLVRGAPGTGKTVIAVQLLADALRLGWSAVHTTGGKAFTTVLKSKFRGANGLFASNLEYRKLPKDALDLGLVDEAHRVRETSDTFRTPKERRATRPQVDEILDACRVTVFLLDENQSVRPGEVGSTARVRSAARARGIELKEYDLAAQFRCGGCREYVAWVDALLSFADAPQGGFGERYRVRLVERPEDLVAAADAAQARGERARLVAGFCWRWSNPRPDGTLVPDVTIGPWRAPWNRKREERKHYTPRNDPYTLWAETEEGRAQVGCIYSAQGFEFDSVGVIWGPDLVWRTDRWVAQPSESHDRPVRGAGAEEMARLVRNAYRVLLTRGTRETNLLCLDPETRLHVADALRHVT